MATAKEALLNLRYTVGVAAEITIALWLLSHNRASPLAWLGYFLLTTSAAMTCFGVVWYWRWFGEIGLRNWYIAALTFLFGCGLIAIGVTYPPNPERDNLIVLWGFTLTYTLPLYCAWRLARLAAIRAFRVLLIAVSQLGSAWRGELPPP